MSAVSVDDRAAERAKIVALWNRGKEAAPTAPAIQPLVNGGVNGISGYAAAALASETRNVRDAVEGTRNDTLNDAAYSLAQLVAAGHLPYQLVHDELLAASHVCGLPAWEAERTIGSGFRGGRKQPRQVIITGGTPPAPDVQEVTHINGHRAADADEPDEARHTSWLAQPLTERADADTDHPAPTLLIRSDGHALLYPGKINGLIGESESGKTWVAMHAGHQCAASGDTVLILDFEDTPGTTRRRLADLGCTAEAFQRIRYANPDEALTALAAADLDASIDGPTLIILDGVNAAMTLLGLDLNSNTDATLFHTKLLKPLTARGAAVLTVDHVPKNAEQRGKGGIGAQAKRAMMSGCAIRVEVSEPFGKGHSGKLKLWVDKDRPGYVRGISGSGKYAGTFILDSTGDAVRAHIAPPNNATGERMKWRPTATMARVSALLQAGAMSKKAVETTIGGRAETIRQALEALVDEGYVTREQGLRGALLHRSVRAFSEAVEDVDDSEI